MISKTRLQKQPKMMTLQNSVYTNFRAAAVLYTTCTDLVLITKKLEMFQAPH